uniref:Uncharacterized protein n=1 Tax=Amphimedon queenslandica TaxID=400682 RepID=A0A1X7VM07_AMPQE
MDRARLKRGIVADLISRDKVLSMNAETNIELPLQGDDYLTCATLLECDEMETDGVSEAEFNDKQCQTETFTNNKQVQLVIKSDKQK